MKLKRWAANLAATAPHVRRLLTRAGTAIRAAETVREASRIEDLMREEIEMQWSQLRGRMTEMLALRSAEVACVNPKAAEGFAEAHQAPIETAAQFKERLWELELALEDRGWVRETTLATLEFSRLGIQQLTRICRIYALKNPIIKRGAIICRLYVFGRGVEIRADDEAANDTIQTFLEANKAEVGHTGLASKEQDIQTDGSLYFGLETKPDGTVTVRMIDSLEIMDVATDPDDTARPLYFLRHWSRCELNPQSGISESKPMKCWYPAIELMENPPAQKPKTIGSVPVNWQMPILRSRDSETPSKWRWAVPPLYASVDWARAYKDFLEDWATIQRSLSRFSLMVETKGGQGAIAAYNALLNTTFADSDGTQIEQNPPPVTGSAHISGPDNKITPFKSAGASTAPEQARRLLLMAAASQGLPETFYGDASTGSLATAQSLDRPTELKFTEIQRRWRFDLERLLRYVLSVSKATPGSKVREASKNGAKPVKITITFPNVIEHQIQPMIQAIAEVGTLGGRNGIAAGIVDRKTIAELFLREIGVEDVDEMLDAMGYGEGYDPADDIEDQRTQAAPQNVTTQPGAPVDVTGHGSPTVPAPAPGAPPVKEMLLRARLDLREALDKIGARRA